MPDFFNPFVIPFCGGILALVIICFIKYYRWYKQFDRLQKMTIRKNILSWKIIPAIWEMFVESILHRRVSQKNWMLGYMHRSIAFGWFLLIVFGAVEDWFMGHALNQEMGFHVGRPFWLSIFYRYFTQDVNVHFKGELLFTNLMDILLLYVLSGIIIAFFKRFFSRIVGMKRIPKHVIFDRFALFALWAIFPLRLLAESITASIANNGGFLTQFIGDFFFINPGYASHIEITFWTLYSVALGTFFVAMPFSRYMHIFTEPFLIFFRNLGIVESEKSTGFTKFELSACSRCGICIDGCPLNSELDIKNVQPIYFLRDIRYKKLQKEIADNCLMCDRCVSDCPVNLESSVIRRQKRDKKELDTHDNYGYIENIQSFNAIGRVIYYSGCMSHLTPGIAESMKVIFESVGQKYWYMDEDKTICCGKPLLEQGFFNQAKELRRKNTNLINQSKAKMLITSCPICYQTFKNDYTLPIEVLHHSEYIDRLIKSGKLKVNKSDLKVVYHDPCQLGRGSGIYKEPRRVLKAVSKLVKPKSEKKKSICCGYNLGNMVIESDQQEKIRNASMNNLLYKDPQLIVTACPMCKKAFTHSNKFPVLDIAEIVSQNITHKKP